MKGLIKPALLLAIMAVCLFGYLLHRQSDEFREFETVFLSLQWMLLACIAFWCGSFIFLTFSLNDLPLIGLLLIAISAYFIGEAASWWMADAIILFAGVTLGRGVGFALMADVGRLKSDDGKVSDLGLPASGLRIFLLGLVMLLAFSSWWHLDMTNNLYHGPRWMGLWDNPNIYGMLMSVGILLSVGLLADRRWKIEDGEQNRKAESGKPKIFQIVNLILIIALFMIGAGLIFSYSRGAWLGAAVGLLYLAKVYGKFKWRYWVLGFGILALGVLLLWGRTQDNAPWYIKRMDFARPSAQHRVSAWRGALQMMRDHPFGVGWNNAVSVYERNYSPPENGAAAITMNSYLMLGTELGLPGVICFMAYVALRLRSPKPKVQSPKLQSAREDARPTNRQDACATLDIGHWILDSGDTTRAACRAGAVALLISFWFDGGLFQMPTASVFWILLELGTSNLAADRNRRERHESHL